MTRTYSGTARTDAKAQSEVLGVVLLLGLSITTIGMVFAFSQPTYEDASDSIEFDRMENEMSLLDAKMATSALGASERQEVSLNIRGGTLSVNPDGSWMNVTYTEPTGDVNTLANVTMGNVKYVRGEREIAYEGGGVWKKSEDSNQSVMVSTPEFHYRGSTLTLPAFNVTNQTSVSGGAQTVSATSEGDPDLLFPNDEFDNPLEKGNVSIKVRSSYYQAWENYFRESTTAAVQGVYDSNQTVEVELLTPAELDLTGSVMYTGNDVSDKHGAIEAADPIDIELPDPETFVNPMVDKCQSGGCEELNSSTYDDMQSGRTYWHDGDYSLGMNGDHVADTGSDNVTMVIDGDLTLDADFQVDSEDNPVKVYVKGDLNYGHNANINNGSGVGSDNASAFEAYVTEDLSEDAGNPINMAGIIYAPNTNHGGSCGGSEKINGNHEFYGSIIVEHVCVQSNAAEINTGDTGVLDLSADVSLIRYLHITENEVRLE